MNAKSIILAASTAIALICSDSARAEYVGVLNITTSEGLQWSTSLTSEEALDGGQFWSAQVIDGSTSIAASMYGFPGEAALGTVVQATNSSNASVDFDISFTMPLVAALTGPRSWNGAMSASVSGEGALLTSVLDLSIFEAIAGADALGSMFAAPFELATNGDGTAASSEESSGVLVLQGSDSLQAHWQFQLGAGTTVMFNGGFGVIPAPGSMALFACALAITRRRSRRFVPSR
jgi:hypothetical protein